MGSFPLSPNPARRRRAGRLRCKLSRSASWVPSWAKGWGGVPAGPGLLQRPHFIDPEQEQRAGTLILGSSLGSPSSDLQSVLILFRASVFSFVKWRGKVGAYHGPKGTSPHLSDSWAQGPTPQLTRMFCTLPGNSRNLSALVQVHFTGRNQKVLPRKLLFRIQLKGAFS